MHGYSVLITATQLLTGMERRVWRANQDRDVDQAGDPIPLTASTPRRSRNRAARIHADP